MTTAINRVSVHRLTDNSVPFKATKYSMFKYGHKLITMKFAKKLAKVIEERFETTNTELFITGAPYNQVPVASTHLAQYVAMYLREWGYTVYEFKINRQHSYHQDYGLMDAVARKASISGETFYTDVNVLQGKNVIFVDDVLITGSHEARIITMMEHLHLKCNALFAYYAAFDDCCSSPQIEDELNSAAIMDEDDIFHLYQRDGILLNTRATKFLLSLDEDLFNQLMISIGGLKKSVKIELYRYGLANGYHTVKEYKNNFNILQLHLDTNKWI